MRADQPRPAFTLVELLVVILIIGIVSVIALPIVLPAMQHREVSEAARLVQGELVGARDKAMRTGRPSGIRLLPDTGVSTMVNGQPDPRGILASNRIIPIDAAPNYSDGSVSLFKDATGGSSNYLPAIRTVTNAAGVWVGVPCLVLEQAVFDAQNLPNPPTNWYWNIRIGDQIQIRNSGPWYTVVGPMTQRNPEQFVNNGPPGAPLPRLLGGSPCEYLLLVNGRDDNQNGWIDEGWDNVDNDSALLANGQPNPGAGITDDAGEWEVERWLTP